MKKTVLMFVCLVMVLIMSASFCACGSSIEEDWSSIIVGQNLPTPQKGKLRSGSNLDNGFYGAIEKVDADYYSEYKKACINMGYIIDSEESENSYKAFNSNGYDLSLYFYDNKISIDLIVPEELSEFSWPTTGIGAKLPAPASSLGKITSDSSNCFRATIGNTSINDYNSYVKSCEEKGFLVDYIKQDGRYEAKNAEGYRLNVSYLGCNRIDIMIQIPKKENPTTSTEITTSKDKTTNEELSKDFKAAMDSYEKFMNEYVAFMEKYKANSSDLSLLTDYADYMSKYAGFVEDFEKWEDEEMNTAETAYYIDVQARVSKKLLEVAQ